VLQGAWEPDRTVLRDEATYSELDARWLLGRRTTSLDVGARAVTLDGDERIEFTGLLIATGATPRALPNPGDLDGIFTLRTLDDCLAIRTRVEEAARVVVVGAGFIGSEVAASCRTRGVEVTVLEALPVPLARVLGEEMGRVCEALHRDHGVDIRCGVGVSGFEGDGAVARVRLADGSAVDADVVVVGVGVRPETGWLEGSALALDDGVVCDETCEAAPGIVAAGDVARWPNPLFGMSMRVEHWTNASEQGTAAARRLLGALGRTDLVPVPFAPVPFFWSDQYDRKIQFVGVASPDDDVRVVHGSVEERQFVALYGRGGRLVGALAFNRPRQLMGFRRLIAERSPFSDALDHAATL
jgi:NADPH-dependent 2,4-dienoyl-CoA reductase/sulfur reductase-like enzyme